MTLLLDQCGQTLSYFLIRIFYISHQAYLYIVVFFYCSSFWNRLFYRTFCTSKVAESDSIELLTQASPQISNLPREPTLALSYWLSSGSYKPFIVFMQVLSTTQPPFRWTREYADLRKMQPHPQIFFLVCDNDCVKENPPQGSSERGFHFLLRLARMRWYVPFGRRSYQLRRQTKRIRGTRRLDSRVCNPYSTGRQAPLTAPWTSFRASAGIAGPHEDDVIAVSWGVQSRACRLATFLP